MRARAARAGICAALAAGALAALPACGAAAPAPSAPATSAPTPSAPTPAAQTPCGATGPTVVANAAGTVAQRIYAAEVDSSEVSADRRQIEGDGPLLRAVESGNRAAIEAAVHGLVYSGTHIVRLRVGAGSKVLSDIGGPYILAPVRGVLRSHGRAIAQFVFSVQDDLGYVKLVARFVGAPLVLRTDSGQVPVEGLLSPGPPSIPDRGRVSYRGTTYEAYSFVAEAFPSGRLRVSLLLPVSRALEAKPCARIKTEELALVTQRISRRFQLSPSTFATFVRLANTMTHALVYVRAGSRTLAGSTRSAPPGLPTSGALRWHGRSYEVASFQAPSSAGGVRVYVLVAA